MKRALHTLGAMVLFWPIIFSPLQSRVDCGAVRKEAGDHKASDPSARLSPDARSKGLGKLK